MEIEREHERITALFADVDEKQLLLIDGAIWEAARLRVELDRLHEIVKKTGLVKVHPGDPLKQRELPVSRMIVRIRANYLNYIAKLSSVLGRSIPEDDAGLEDYE